MWRATSGRPWWLETLRVLRANKDALTTIVAVLIHDPILKWAVSPERANQRQRDDDNGGGGGGGGGMDINNGGGGGGGGGGNGATTGANAASPQEGNLDAQRALNRVEQKLDGYEAGLYTRSLSSSTARYPNLGTARHSA